MSVYPYVIGGFVVVGVSLGLVLYWVNFVLKFIQTTKIKMQESNADMEAVFDDIEVMTKLLASTKKENETLKSEMDTVKQDTERLVDFYNFSKDPLAAFAIDVEFKNEFGHIAMIPIKVYGAFYYRSSSGSLYTQGLSTESDEMMISLIKSDGVYIVCRHNSQKNIKPLLLNTYSSLASASSQSIERVPIVNLPRAFDIVQKIKKGGLKIVCADTISSATSNYSICFDEIRPNNDRIVIAY
jgi:hypothetical protein